MGTPTDKALLALCDSMVQMRHDAVEEIKDGLRERVHELTEEIFEKYIVIDKHTQKPVDEKDINLMESISDSEWYQHEILELLKQNEDDALEQMTWIVEPELAPDGCAPEERFVADPLDLPIPPRCLPVGRDQYLRIVYEITRSVDVQQSLLESTLKYLRMVPDVVNQETAAQEAQSIAKLKHFVHGRWIREAQTAQHMYILLMRGRGQDASTRALGDGQRDTVDTDMDMS